MKNIQLRTSALTFCILITLNLSAQLSSKDSLIIKKFEGVSLTDSLNSKLPKDIRLITIQFLSKRGLNPSEYYSLGPFQPFVGPALDYDKVGFLNLLRINALRELASDHVHIGAAGGKDDDIQILFDKKYKRVMTMISSE